MNVPTTPTPPTIPPTPPTPTPGPLVVTENYPDTTLDLLANIYTQLGGSIIEVEEKYFDRGDDLLYAILKRLHGGGYTPPTPDNNTGSYLVYGNATWNSALLFDVTACLYFILGTPYISLANQVELAPADADNPRIDVIFVDIDGNVNVLTGEPAPTPIKPQIDPETQLEISFVLVPANSLVPGNIVNEDIYQENAEWEGFTDFPSTGNIFESDNAPQSGNLCVEIPRFVIGGRLGFSKGSLLKESDYQYLRFYIRVENGTLLNREFSLSLFFSLGPNIVAGALRVTSGLFGFDIENEEWQLVTIPFSNFAFTSSNFDNFIIQANGFAARVSFDNIVLQGQTIATPGGGGLQDLQSVTDQGNETTNGISVISSSASSKGIEVYNSDDDAGIYLSINPYETHSEGQLQLANSQGGLGVVHSKLLTEERNYNFPNKSGTFAMTSDIVFPDKRYFEFSATIVQEGSGTPYIGKTFNYELIDTNYYFLRQGIGNYRFVTPENFPGNYNRSMIVQDKVLYWVNDYMCRMRVTDREINAIHFVTEKYNTSTSAWELADDCLRQHFFEFRFYI